VPHFVPQLCRILSHPHFALFWGPLWLTGGINRRHPDEQDFRRAAEFAGRMQLAMRPQPAHKSLIEQPVLRAEE
jgi:hypothetical protein